MKKNKWMRLAALMLVLCLITTCTVSGTYAKYTTQDKVEDSARVAKWGVELQVAGLLYGPHYDSTNLPLAHAGNDAATVSAYQATGGKADDVVAPGTLGDNLSFSVNGQPEVSGKVVIELQYENIYLKEGNYGVMVYRGEISKTEFTAFTSTNPERKFYTKETSGGYKAAESWTSGVKYYTLEDYVELANDYFPVEYKMTGTTTSYNTSYGEGVDSDTLAELCAALTANFGTGTSNVADGKVTLHYEKAFTPNTDLKDLLQIEGQMITWKWDFCQSSPACADGDEACKFCKADTILGNLQRGDSATAALNGEVVKVGSDGRCKIPVAAAGTAVGDYNLETCFGIDITVTQVD